jgi:hypothetical protein
MIKSSRQSQQQQKQQEGPSTSAKSDVKSPVILAKPAASSATPKVMTSPEVNSGANLKPSQEMKPISKETKPISEEMKPKSEDVKPAPELPNQNDVILQAMAKPSFDIDELGLLIIKKFMLPKS